MKVKEEVKELWKLCFEDTDEFIEMYFGLRYSSETTMVIKSGNRIVSSLQMPYYTMTFDGTEVQTAYISGACTHPDFRGKGVMAQLLAESFSRMVHKNIPLSILIPANAGLYDYYARTGYAPAFFRSIIKQDASVIRIHKGNLHFSHITAFDKRIYDYFREKALQRPNYVQHTASDFEVVMEDLRIGGGGVTVAYRDKDESICGVLFACPEEGYLKVPEWFADNEAIRDNLIREAVLHYNQPNIVRFGLPHGSAEEKRFGMARIIDAKVILQLYAAKHTDISIRLKLTDEQLAFNNGYYDIARGVCSFSDKPQGGEYPEITTQQLSARLFDGARLYMSLMLE